MPEVSVIIPNYNHCRFLIQRIESVLNQTYTDFELIILDDCSSDNSKDIINKYHDHPKVSHIIYNTTNSGSTFKQWKKGIELAIGNYIWLAESDDYADVKLLETLIKPLLVNSDIIVSYCQSMIVDESNNYISICNWADSLDSSHWKRDYIEVSQIEVEKYLKYKNTIPNASAVLFKKPNTIIFEKIIKMRFTGDWLFWKTILSYNYGKIAFSHHVLNFFRTHSETTRSNSTAEKEEMRFKEFTNFIDTKNNSILSNKYDWMIYEWLANRKVFSNSLRYYTTFFPLKTAIRCLILQIRFKIRSLAHF